jgi:ABC-type uncharacterized transport system auxiliary subunit
MNASLILLAILFEVLLGACAGKLPETRFYQLAATQSAAEPTGDATLILETLETDPAYDDDRIVYRTTPYRLDYYQYHRWSATPGTMVGDYLEQAFESSGKFRSVLRDATADAPAVLGGRVLAIEEIDTSKTSWQGRIVIELRLTETKTNTVLWTQQFEETEPLAAQTPEGLAKALSTAMARIATRAAPVVAEHVDRQSKLHLGATN